MRIKNRSGFCDANHSALKHPDFHPFPFTLIFPRPAERALTVRILYIRVCNSLPLFGKMKLPSPSRIRYAVRPAYSPIRTDFMKLAPPKLIFRLCFCLGLPVLLLPTSCTTTGPPVGAMPTSRQMTRYLMKPADPQTYWIQPYMTEHGPAFRNANRTYPGHADILPFISAGDSSRPLVMAAGYGREEIPALFDTTSRGNWMDFYTCQLTQVVPLAKTTSNRTPLRITPTHVQDPLVSYSGILSSMRFGKVRFENPVVNIRPQYLTLGPLGRSGEAPEALMVVGTDCLRKLSFFQIDYPGRRVGMATSEPYTMIPETVVAVLPLFDYKGAFAVRGRLDNYEGYILVDCAGDYTVAMSGNQSSANLRVEVLRLDNLDVESHHSQNLTEPEFPRLGRGLLSKYRVTFDIKKSRLILQKPFYEEPTPEDRSLFGLRPEFNRPPE